MTEGIKYLIECEREAREKLEEAIRAAEYVDSQAKHDADIFIKNYIAKKELEYSKYNREVDQYLEERKKIYEHELEIKTNELKRINVNKIAEEIAEMIISNNSENQI